MRRVCKGTPVVSSEQSGDGWPGHGGGCGECVRVHRYTMSKQSGPAVNWMARALPRNTCSGVLARPLMQGRNLS